MHLHIRNALFALFALIATSASIAKPVVDGMTWQSLADAESTRRSATMLLYFGAEWCAPCKMLETQVFNQPEIAAAMKPFVGVYVDGDAPGAAAAMERYGAAVFPTLLAISVDGKEIGRFVGSAEKADFARFLAASSSPESIESVLDAIANGTADATRWARAGDAQIADLWRASRTDEASLASRRALRDKLAKAVDAIDRTDPAPTATAAARLRMRLLLMDAVGDKPDGMRARHRRALDGVLDEPALVEAAEQVLMQAAEEMLVYLTPEIDASRRALAKRVLQALDALSRRDDASPTMRLETVLAALPLLPWGSADADADKARYAELAEALLAEAASPPERLAMVQEAARVLRRTGRELRGEAVLRETLKLAPDAYYLNGTLAAYAKLRGDLDGAEALARQAYRGSLATTGGVSYGVLWLEHAIARDPRNRDHIDAIAAEVVDRARGTREAFQGWGKSSMDRLATMIGQWLGGLDDGADDRRALMTARFVALCASVAHDADQTRACAETLAKLEAAPAA